VSVDLWGASPVRPPPPPLLSSTAVLRRTLMGHFPKQKPFGDLWGQVQGRVLTWGAGPATCRVGRREGSDSSVDTAVLGASAGLSDECCQFLKPSFLGEWSLLQLGSQMGWDRDTAQDKC
jgi:hypothetical protein